MFKSRPLSAAAGLCLLTACSLAPPTPTPRQVSELPGHFATPHADGRAPPREWWKGFNDPVLDHVVNASLLANLDLAQAVARVAQARARARIAAASQLPSVRGALGAQTLDAPTNAGIGAQLEELGLGPDVYRAFGIALPDRIGLDSYALGVEFAYETDFWGRSRNAALAAGAERLASEADYRAARIGVIAETVATYLEIVDLSRQAAYGDEVRTALGEHEAFAQRRYDAGLIDIRALYAARRNLRNATADSARIAARLADAEGRLWVLLGGYRKDLASLLSESAAPTASPDPVPPGIPADLLVQRPDVRAARQRLEAARYALGAHRAALLPSLSLSGAIGLESTEVGDWFDPDQWYRNLSANLLAPLFEGGRLRGKVALAEARLDEAAAVFGRSVVTAVKEVDAALAEWRANRSRLSTFTALANAAEAEAALQEKRFLAGVADYAAYLTASRGLSSAKATRSRAQRDLGLARLALHRALGGGWTGTDVPAAAAETQPHGAAETPTGLRAKLRDLWNGVATRQTPKAASAEQ